MNLFGYQFSNGQVIRLLIVLLLAFLLMPTIVSAFTHQQSALQGGTIDQPANGTTVISVQGFKIAGKQSEKKPARLVGVGPRGDVQWTYNGSENDIVWFYDVDPLENGSLFITGTRPGETVATVWNPQTKETAWSRTFHWEDTHDVDLINGDQLLVANMRNYNETTKQNNDRLLLYDLSKNETVWEWKFRNHGYSRDGGGKYTDDWTHVNDVDKIGPGRYLASPRNFDQVIVVNRSSKEVTHRLGSDGALDVMYEQHNPQYLEGSNGSESILIADSENDRIVEYSNARGAWNRTWRLTGSFQWPRDADRLPDGNTLVTDSLNHRVMEVTPQGQVVWEFYAPWGTYEAERMQLGDEAGGPTIREQGAVGTANLSGSAALRPGTGSRLTFSEWMTNAFAGTPIESQAAWFGERWAHVTPWIRPVWMGPWDFVRSILAIFIVIGWISAEVYVRRGQFAKKMGRFQSR
jgi:hypothetical protein